jgi:hypothetical membrane protein
MSHNFLDIALAGPALFILTALVFGLVKPKYRPLHNTISELALGRYGYIQTANFILSGSLMALLGLRIAATHQHLYGAVAIVVMGLVLVLSAVFRTDSIASKVSTTTGRIQMSGFAASVLGW